jgi:hypothetical protein
LKLLLKEINVPFLRAYRVVDKQRGNPNTMSENRGNGGMSVFNMVGSGHHTSDAT